MTTTSYGTFGLGDRVRIIYGPGNGKIGRVSGLPSDTSRQYKVHLEVDGGTVIYCWPENMGRINSMPVMANNVGDYKLGCKVRARYTGSINGPPTGEVVGVNVQQILVKDLHTGITSWHFPHQLEIISQPFENPGNGPAEAASSKPTIQKADDYKPGDKVIIVKPSSKWHGKGSFPVDRVENGDIYIRVADGTIQGYKPESVALAVPHHIPKRGKEVDTFYFHNSVTGITIGVGIYEGEGNIKEVYCAIAACRTDERWNRKRGYNIVRGRLAANRRTFGVFKMGDYNGENIIVDIFQPVKKIAQKWLVRCAPGSSVRRRKRSVLSIAHSLARVLSPDSGIPDCFVSDASAPLGKVSVSGKCSNS